MIMISLFLSPIILLLAYFCLPLFYDDPISAFQYSELSLLLSSIALRLAYFDFILNRIYCMLSFRDLISVLYTPLMISCLEQL